MEHDIFARQLRLLELLAGNTRLTTGDLAARLGLSRRSVYRYLEMFRVSGFHLSRRNGVHAIDYSSPFITALADKMRLTADEVELIAQLLAQADGNAPLVARLRQRFGSIYAGGAAGSSTAERQHIADNTALLQQAVRERRKAVLHAYHSPHSQTTSDRLVEPFKLVSPGGSVRCYEPAAHACKTFKVARIGGRVELLREHWTHAARHITYYTDLFGFSAETTHRVVLRLGRLATRILIEEYGISPTQLVIDGDDGHMLYALRVCSYQGVGRFVLGLINDVQVVQGDGLRNYLRRQLAAAPAAIGSNRSAKPSPTAPSPLDTHDEPA